MLIMMLSKTSCVASDTGKLLTLWCGAIACTRGDAIIVSRKTTETRGGSRIWNVGGRWMEVLHWDPGAKPPVRGLAGQVPQ